jgi:uridine kinase
MMTADLKLLKRKKQLYALIMREVMSRNSIIQSLKPNFFERLNTMVALQRPVLVAISGESASGKTTFVKVIKEQAARVQERRENLILSTIKGDNYFNDISEGIQKYGSFDALLASGYNPDAPSSFQLDLMRRDLGALMMRDNVLIPRYQLNGTGVSIPNCVEIPPAEVIIVEGMCSLYDDIHDIFDLKIFVDIDANVQRERYLVRCKERNQAVEDAKKQLEIVSNSAQQYIKPTKKYADIVINGNANLDELKTFAMNFLRIIHSVDEPSSVLGNTSSVLQVNKSLSI